MKHALVVDDSPTVRRILRRIMESLAFRVTEAEDGEVALAICGTDAPDVVLLDWNMPVLDGIGFLRALRAGRARPAPVVIFCTSMNSLPHIQEALEAGADEYVMKPFDEAIIRGKLEQTGVL